MKTEKSNEQIKVLLIDDDEDDYLLIREAFSEFKDKRYHLDWISTFDEGLESIERDRHDVCLVDYRLGERDGVDLISEVRKRGIHMPMMILLTGQGDLDLDLEAMSAGAVDYLVKGETSSALLERSIRYTLKQNEVENSLRQSQQQYESLVHSIEGIVWEADPKTLRFTFVSNQAEQMLGFRAEQWLRDPNFWTEHLHPDDRKRAVEYRQRALAKSENYDFDYRMIAADGRTVWLRDMVTVDAKDSNEARLRGMMIDITTRKQAEEERDNFFNVSLDMLCIVGIDGYFKRINPAWETTLGFTTEEFLAKPLIEFVYPKDREKVISEITKLIKRGETIALENRFLCQDGTYKWLSWKATPVAERRLSYGVAHDTTERKAYELSLSESKEQITNILESITDGFFTLNRDWEFTYVNPTAESLLLRSQKDLLGKNIWGEFRAAVDTAFYAMYQRVMDENITVNFTEFYQPLGLWVEVHAYPAKEGISVYFQDITERKRLEEEKTELNNRIERKRQRLNNIITNLPGVVWESWAEPDAAMQRINFVSDYVETMLGYSAEEWLSTPKFWLSIVHPDDKERVMRLTSERFAGCQNFTQEFRWIAKDGRVVWVESQAGTTCDDEGNPVCLRGVNLDITERKRSERLLRESEEKFRSIVETANEGIWLIDGDGQTTYANRQLAQMLGYAVEEMLGRPLFDFIFTEDVPEAEGKMAERNKGISAQGEFRLRRKNGSGITVLYNASTTRNQAGEVIGLLAMIVDITERKSLEEQLRQSQKLESLGRLAGGIAHDFNNMLTAINGYSDLVLRKLASDNPLRSHIEEIKKAGNRSAALTQQLLAFSRQQVMQPKVLNLNEVIIDTSSMLQRLIGEDVQLHLSLNAIVSRIKADPGQLTQVIMNLVVNAQDAMPQGGNLIIETADVFLDDEYTANHVPTKPGSYVMLAVTDTGSGIDAEIRQQIFEPFFTTKEIGQGTGLGLATVYGIVKQSGGFIWVESEVGMGSTFRIYFPPVKEAKTGDEVLGAANILRKGTETILLVEDEEIVRILTRQMLEECGYHVLEATTGMQALEICEQNDCKIDLLMTDVVMPGMNGREVSERLALTYPEMKVLFTSGYTDDAVVRHGVVEADINFIQKPFTFEALAQKVGEVLDSTD